MDRLDRRCQKVIKGSHRYKDGLSNISQQQLSFADTMEDFCGGTDEESLMLGNRAAICFVVTSERYMHGVRQLMRCDCQVGV